MDELHIFGYGSLMWKPDFKYSTKEHGYIRGYQRRFWQSNTEQRGTKEKPGRVATLIKADNQKCLWGVKFTVKGAKKVTEVLEKLSVREKILGSYVTVTTKFYSKNSNYPCDVLLYQATEKNPLYTGPSAGDEEKDLQYIADTVVHAHGSAGPNSEYITKLADYIRKHIPEEMDEHLFILDKLIRNKLIHFHEYRHQG
ncbi:putative glutathione-specific gamma-glutamylcyclotransferase 2 [Saccostrea cucullata]|uniref:putative glutathione-specific gamma-glutamylcyclotransferase 2 n=1 Tax=Saccostrea cuccullata TaxID=36930 RepID=UPI002ED6B71C